MLSFSPFWLLGTTQGKVQTPVPVTLETIESSVVRNGSVPPVPGRIPPKLHLSFLPPPLAAVLCGCPPCLPLGKTGASGWERSQCSASLSLHQLITPSYLPPSCLGARPSPSSVQDSSSSMGVGSCLLFLGLAPLSLCYCFPLSTDFISGTSGSVSISFLTEPLFSTFFVSVWSPPTFFLPSV